MYTSALSDELKPQMLASIALETWGVSQIEWGLKTDVMKSKVTYNMKARRMKHVFEEIREKWRDMVDGNDGTDKRCWIGKER